MARSIRPDVATLEGIGRWMSVNVESIRGTQRTPLDRQAWGDSTVKGNTVYLHVFEWPANRRLVVGGLLSQVSTAYLLNDPEKKPLKLERVGSEDLSVCVPATAPDAVDSVIVLKTTDGVKAKQGRLLGTHWGNNRLLGFDATTDGVDFSYGDGKAARYYVDDLEKKGNALRWNVRMNESGKLDVSILYSTAKPSVATGSQFVVHLGSQTLTAPIVATSSPTKMQTLHMGELNLQPSMLQDLSVSTTEGADKIHFFEVDLKPLLRSEARPLRH